MWRKFIAGVLLLGAVAGLTGCGAEESTAPTASPMPTATAGDTALTPTSTERMLPTAVLKQVRYPFTTGDAIGNSPLRVSITTGGKKTVYAASTKIQTAAGCKVLYYAAGTGTGSPVTHANQQQLSRAALESFLAKNNTAGTPFKVFLATLATTEQLNGKPALIETEAATYVAAGKTTTAHFRAFTNNEVLVYVQTCPNDAILNTDKNVQLIID